jgi:outer membrane protein
MVLGNGFLKTISTAALLAMYCFTAHAADLPTMKAPEPPPPFPASPLGFFVRLGVTYAINTSKSSISVAPVPGGPASFTIPGANASIGDLVTLGVEAGYFVTQQISVEVAAGLPQWSHDTISNPLAPPGTPPSGTILAKVSPSAIPITVNYHFMNFGAFQPYVGAGFAPLFSARTHDGFVTGVSVQPTVGAVLAAGADVMIDRHWGVDFNVKKIFASVTSTGTGVVAAPGVPIAIIQKTQFQPWILSTGVTYRF